MNELWHQLEAVRTGWVRRAPILPGEACMVTNRCGGELLSCRAVSLVTQVLSEQFPSRQYITIGPWNDLEATKEQVELVLEKAAIRYDELYG